MNRTAPHSASTEPPAPLQEDRPSTAMPTYIAAILSVVRVLLGYGKHLDEILPDRASHKHFPTLAAGFGTHDVRRILGHIQRGILRAMMLERFLLARAAQGRDIEPVERPAPAEPADIEGLELKLPAPSQPRAKHGKKADPNDPMHFAIPTLKELESQVRRRNVGRTIAEIALDLGVIPSFCAGATLNDILGALLHFGADLEQFFGIQTSRRETFRKQRDNRSAAPIRDWQDSPRDAFRELVGHLIGEPPPAASLAGPG